MRASLREGAPCRVGVTIPARPWVSLPCSPHSSSPALPRSCGRLAFHIQLPYSFLHFPYVESAIRFTHSKDFCGNCSLYPNSTHEVWCRGASLPAGKKGCCGEQGAGSWRGAEGHCVRRRGLVGLWWSAAAGLEELTQAIGLKKERGRQWTQRWHARSGAKHMDLCSADDQSLPKGKIHTETLNAKPLFWLRNSLEHRQLGPRDVCKEVCSPWAPASPACPGPWLESQGSIPCPFLWCGCCSAFTPAFSCACRLAVELCAHSHSTPALVFTFPRLTAPWRSL